MCFQTDASIKEGKQLLDKAQRRANAAIAKDWTSFDDETHNETYEASKYQSEIVKIRQTITVPFGIENSLLSRRGSCTHYTIRTPGISIRDAH